MAARVRLGVNVDHVATVRNARGGPHPDPLRAAALADATVQRFVGELTVRKVIVVRGKLVNVVAA